MNRIADIAVDLKNLANKFMRSDFELNHTALWSYLSGKSEDLAVLACVFDDILAGRVETTKQLRETERALEQTCSLVEELERDKKSLLSKQQKLNNRIATLEAVHTNKRLELSKVYETLRTCQNEVAAIRARWPVLPGDEVEVSEEDVDEEDEDKILVTWRRVLVESVSREHLYVSEREDAYVEFADEGGTWRRIPKTTAAVATSPALLLNAEDNDVVERLVRERRPRVALSKEARAAREPLRPEELVGALHDNIHEASERLRLVRPAQAIKVPDPKTASSSTEGGDT